MHSIFRSVPQRQQTYFLDVLWTGLERLYKELRKIECEKLNRLKQGGGEVVAHWSLGDQPEDPWITNNFVWYASSGACFLQLFDHAYGLGETYRSEFASMLKWRDKVAAHTAHVKPVTDRKRPRQNKIDSPASQDLSIMMSPEWHGDHYAIGGIVLTDNSPGEVEPKSSHTDWRWALTRIHPKIEAYLERHLDTAD